MGDENAYRYKYNGIEEIDDFGLDLSFAMFRTLDPTIGRWLQVDPKGEGLAGMTPYNSMANNPISFNDPNGDFIHIAIGAAIGGVINLAVQGYQGNIGSIGDGLAAFGIGAVAGGVGAATGGATLAAMGTTSSLGGAIGAGALTGAVGGASAGLIEGVGNAMYFQDQNFGDAISGAGLRGMMIGGIVGGVLGGIGGGIKYGLGSNTSSGNFDPGKPGGPGVYDEFIDPYANHSVSGGGQSVRLGSSISEGVTLSEQVVVSATRPNNFNISNWTGYPSALARPRGPFRLLQGEEYRTARNLANSTNAQLRRQWGLKGKPNWEIHEIHPVKFGGSPTALSNKVVLPRGFHRSTVTPWWNRLMRTIK